MTQPARKLRRALVVDDDPATLSSIEAILKGRVEVTTCASSTRALRLLQEERFHVLCASHDMPVLNGLELIAEATRLSHHVGCLLLTSAAVPVRKEAGGRHYVLLRPYDPKRLVALVEQLARLADMKHSVSSMRLPKP